MKYVFVMLMLFVSTIGSAQHPAISLTEEGVQGIRSGLGNTPYFDKVYEANVEEVNQAILKGIDIPIPVDMAGGYTHEQHKYNYKIMHKASILYQISGDATYAEFVRDMLLGYAKIYPTLPLHPTMKSYATGKIFWQSLNDANWLVFTSQTYDNIYNFLTVEQRNHLEKDLFKPMADFLSIENPRFFNRVHNHSTWGNAAVGMIALVMDDEELLKRALYGLEQDDIDKDEKDDDGGFIKKDGVAKAGFFAQLDYSFSPDGYFAEGPYYQRYAIVPFLMFSQALNNKKPDLKIFEYRDSILKKGTFSLLQLSDSKGKFFPINDAQKGMSFETYEAVYAVDLLYFIDPKEVDLLNWASIQNTVDFGEAGYITAKALKNHTPAVPQKQSMILKDGVAGNEGGIALLRGDKFEILFKATTQGMGHGHFDRLSYSAYNDLGEVIQDYGAVRWVNIDQKGGGRYLPENKTFGKHSIAHNTVVKDSTSHFYASVAKAEEDHPDFYYSDFNNDSIQMVSAIENGAYENTSMHRALFLINDEDLANEVFIDVFQISADSNSTYDLPLWYLGHQMQDNAPCQKKSAHISALGSSNGYEHIWEETSCELDGDSYSFTWLQNDRFFSLLSNIDEGDVLYKGRAGANDPNFNIRPDPVLIHRKSNIRNATFVQLIEEHGHYSRLTEVPIQPYPTIDELEVLFKSKDYTIFTFSNSNYTYTVHYCLSNNDETAQHRLSVADDVYQWNGVYQLTKKMK